MAQLFAARSERDGNFRYAPDKWSVKEVVGHMSDSERIFAYRALRIARGDQSPLQGFEQDDYVREGNFGERTLLDLAEEFALVRASTIAFFKSLRKEAWTRRGMATKPKSPCARWLLLWPGTNCTTGKFSRSVTSRRFLAPDSRLALNANARAIT